MEKRAAIMTDAALQGLGAAALNMAKRDIEQGGFNFLLATYHTGEPLYRMKKVEALIIQKLGKDWLNHGRTKDAGFHVMRVAVHVLPPDAVVFVTAANGFSATEKFEALPQAQQDELLEAGHDRHHQAVREGLLEIQDVLLAIAQSPERVCMYQQGIDRHGGLVGQPQARCCPQDDYDGRMKLYGAMDSGGGDASLH
jgi:hypothetical protein